MADEKKSRLPWGMSEAELKPNSVQELSKSTLKAFQIGMTNPALKSNPFQKSREDKEKKKQREEEETAKVLEEFVTTFEETSKAKMMFVRGAVINPDKDSTAVAGTLYEPAGAKKVVQKPATDIDTPPPPPKPTKKKDKEKKKESKSVLEMFGEELKRIQEERKERQALKKSGELPLEAPDIDEEKQKFKDEYSAIPKGSYDRGDPLTTNLYIGNINPKMNEEMLCQHFGKFGPLASVKIMWPRTEEERSRNRNCGFVAFMKRKDAEKALDAMKGSTILGHEVEIGWGKTVPLPPTPFYVAPDHSEEKSSFIPDPPSGLPFNARPMSRRSRGSSGRGTYNTMPPPEGMGGDEPRPYDDDPMLQSFDDNLYNSIVKVVLPSDKEVLCLIHRMIEFIIREGPMFEAMIMNKEMGNQKFKFLFDNQSPEHVYYRWKMFSILQGDSPETWKTDEFRMFEGGSLWRPPPLKNLRGKVLPPIMEIVKRGQLPQENRDHLEDMLRNVTMERPKIRDGMIWCMEHAESSDEIVECITESLSLSETPLPLKLARLYLLTDILQNSNAHVSCAARYRRGFENKLLTIMEHFHDVMMKIDSRLRAESFKRRVLRCLQSWDQLTVYHFNFVDKLREQFIGKSQEEIEKKKAFETVAALMSLREEEETDPLDDNKPIDFSGGQATFDEEDIDGEPLADPDVDGVPMEEDNEDIDGVPMEEDVPLVSKTAAVVQSKWELVDYGQGSSSEEEVEEKKKRKEEERPVSALSSSSSQVIAINPATTDDSDKRQQLRDVELKVIELMEALESSGSYSQKEIQDRTAKFREKLLQNVAEGRPIMSSSDSPENISSSSKTDKKRDKDGDKKGGKDPSIHRSRKRNSRDRSLSPADKGDRSRSPSSRSSSSSSKKKKHSSPSSKRRSRSRERHKTSDKHKSPSRKRSRSRSPHGGGRHRSKSPRRARSRSPHRSSSKKEKRHSRSPSPHKSKKNSRR